MPRPCQCDRFEEVYKLTDCRLCWLYHHNPFYKSLWDGEPLPTPAAASGPRVVVVSVRNLNAPCVHRGEQVSEMPCSPCQGNVLVKVFSCKVYSLCTIGKVIGEIACCATCSDYKAAQ